MKLKYISLIMVIVLTSSVVLAQSSMMERSLHSEKDSLLLKKKETTLQKEQLLCEIDSLRTNSVSLTNKIDKANLEIEELYSKKFGNEIGTRIFSKQIWKGMTEKMLQASWGKPDKIDKNVEKWGVFTQWHYGKITFFFRDGELTDWEELK